MVLSVGGRQDSKQQSRIEDRQQNLPRNQQDINEEARKEELRRFVREKWKRIRELESQSSPAGAASSESEGEGSSRRSSIIRKESSRGSRASSVEYDPENPFDDDKKRNQISETSKMNAPIKKLAARENIAEGATLVNSNMRHKSASMSKTTKGRGVVRTDLDKPSTKVAVKVSQPMQQVERSAGIQRREGANKEQRTVKARDDRGKTTRQLLEVSPKKVVPLKKTSSNESSTLKDRDEESRSKASASKSVATVVLSKADKERQDAEMTEKEFDTPVRRKKTTSDHQPVAVVSLSVDTSNALAVLEASLARLKARSTKTSSSTAKRKSPKNEESSNKMEEEPLRSRRSLSPAKEMRQMQLEVEKQRIIREASPPRVSFLQRIELKRAEATSPSLSSIEPHLTTKKLASAMEKETEKEKGKEKENRVEAKKIVKRNSYTPTQRQPEPGTSGSKDEKLGDESSCSIVIGDESIDDVIRHRKASKFLSNIRVFVDVRDQDGEDASSGWIEKLESVGAKVYSKLPSKPSSSEHKYNEQMRCKLTHIVYKNGRPSTLHYLRSMTSNQPGGQTPPIVVGVNWILESLQQGVKIDERDFLVEVGKQAIFNKPRISMTSKRAPIQSTSNRSSHQNLAELLAKKKTIQHAPAQPSPLARRCWNMDASTSSSISAATSYNANDGQM